jgi:endogenous inhibitor of DNA gyrase (YacG/DUF329 family)
LKSPSDKNINADLKSGECPICQSPAVKDYAPFCSKRCADVDLHRWLTEGYSLPAEEDDSDGTPPDPDKA